MAIDLLTALQYTFFQNAVVAGACAGLLCSFLGVFIVLRRASLIGEGVAHLSFGGIALGLFLSIYPLETALLVSLLGIFAISFLQRRKIVYSETAIGILFSLGLAMGAVLASLRGGFNVDLFSYLFGSILTVGAVDLYLIISLTAICLVLMGVFFKEMFFMTFDEPGAKISGVPTGWLEIIFNVMIALTVVVSIKIVGSLLISALLIIPAASAMQLSRSFKGTVLISMFLGLTTVLAGLFASVVWDVATGGVVVLISVAVFIGCVIVRKFSSPTSPAVSQAPSR